MLRSPIPSKEEMRGVCDTLPQGMQDEVACCVAPFHIRNGGKHEDGSMGEIRITPGQLRDLLAYVYRRLAEK